MTTLEAAWQRRSVLHELDGTTAYRLLNRAGDGFPTLSVDRFSTVLIANLYERTAPPYSLLQALADRAGALAVYVKHRPLQASGLDEQTRAQLAPEKPLLGRPLPRVEVLENGLSFLIRPAEGLNPGLFLDMRPARARLQKRVRNQTVLNCFAYTCGFAVAALNGGAARVLNLDISRRYLDWGRQNVELNGFSTVPTDFLQGDVMDWLNRLGRRGQRFDWVILDPPSYSTTRNSRFTVERDYPRLVAMAAKVVQPGGWLMACTNQEQLTLRAFLARIRQGLQGQPARIIRTEHEPELDFPVAPGGKPYLKVCLVRIGSSPAR